MSGKIFNVLFGSVNERSYHRYIRSVKISHGRKTAYSALVEKVEHKGLDRIVEMMPERDLIRAEPFRRLVESAASELRAERARAFLLAYVENYLRYVGFLHEIFHAELLAQTRDGGIIRLRSAVAQLVEFHINGYGDKLEFFRIEARKRRQRVEQRKRILPRRYADRDNVAVLYHTVIVASSASVA